MNRLASRSRKIAEVLARNGLTTVAHEAGLTRWLPLKYRAALPEEISAADLRPETLVTTLQQFGATFVKLGQTLAMRPDLLPPAYSEALATLTDNAAAVSADEIRAQIEEELGAPCSQLFTSFDETPLGVASIAQVHAAVLPGGLEVVVKVRKPGVREDVESDLALLRTLARALERSNRAFKNMDLTGIVADFATTMTAELDFTTEAATCQQMAELLADEPQVHIPWIEANLTTSGVMTQQRIRGTRIDDLATLRALGLDPVDVARLYAHALMRMVFDLGVFHADPHAGNVFVLADSSLTFIDWGMTGRIRPDLRLKLVQLLMAFSLGEPELIAAAFIDIAPPRGQLDRAGLSRDVGALLEYVRLSSLQDINVGEVIDRALAVVRGHHLALPTDVSVLLRMLVISEGLVRALDPEVSVLEIAERQARASFLGQLRPEHLMESFKHQAITTAVFAKELPQRLGRILDRAESGEIDINMRGDAIEGSMRSLNRITNRLVGGMVTSASIVAGALIFTAARRK